MITNQIKSRLKLVRPLLREAVNLTRAMSDSRLAPTFEEKRELQDLALEIASFAGEIDSFLGEYRLMGVMSKRTTNK